MQTITPNHSGSISAPRMIGSEMGSTMISTEIQSSTKPRMKTTSRNRRMISKWPSWWPSMTFATSSSPPWMMKMLANSTPPMTISMTIEVILIVCASASLRTLKENCR